MDLQIIKEETEPNINSYGEQYGQTVHTTYKCPCGKGTVTLTQEQIPGWYDFWANINCKKCDAEYELQWGKGVYPGHSPMIEKRHI